MTGWLIAALLAAGTVTAQAVEDKVGDAGEALIAREVTVRKGLGNFYAKCVPGATVRVAFFGGSITEADGWKTFTMENLRRRFPETKFELIDAALGGTGSDYGTYRLAKDVLPHKPDLMFVEFLTNDGDANRLRAIEGYVRNTYRTFPECDIVIVYTLNKLTAPTFQRGFLPPGGMAFERVAERYGIPSMAMGLRAAEMANRGELVWNKGDTQVKALAGKETEKDRPEDASGPIVFLSDGAHPYRETGHRLYAEAVARGLDAIAAAKLPPVDRRTLPEPLEPAMGSVRFYSPEAAQKAGLQLRGAGWRNDTTIQTSWWKTRPSFYKFYESSWRSGPGEGSISFRFKGASVLFAPLYGPGTGAAEITVDGTSRRVDFFDMYSAFWRMGPYLLCDGLDPNAVHEVTIRNLPGACDREKVMRAAGRGEDYAKYKADFQVEQELMFCGLFVEGEIVPFDGAAVSVAGFCERAARREPLTVAFFGGSLTWGANATDPNYTSWRGRICERLRATYPNTPFRFIDAAIGGTGSELGVFRLERDVLRHRPDLMFQEWAVNDGYARSNDNASCSYEGIIRRVLAEAPGCVPVPVILPDRRTMTTVPAAELRRRAEHLAIAKRYNLDAVDILGTLRKAYESGKDETDAIWPAEIGDNTHPHDYGYGVYADIVWDAVFAHPSDRIPKLTPEPMFPPKYAHVCRQRLNALGYLPAGWSKGYNAMRAGTFDFLCSRRQDGIVRATNGGGRAPAPFRLKFRGEVLLIYGESTVKSGRCEIWVDGKRCSDKDCASFGRAFAPSAYNNWPIASDLDPDATHELEIRPTLKDGEEQEINIESVCVAGRNGAWVRLADESAVDGYLPLARTPDAIEANGATVEVVPAGDRAEVYVTATNPLERVTLSWDVDFADAEVLGDHWERTYVDTYWRPVRIPRAMPWYFLCKTRGRTDGYGVMTQPNAFASWRTDGRRLTLTLDVRAAGRPVNLRGRRLHAVTLVSRKGGTGESAYAAGRAFCRMMCPKPRLAKAPVYGYNDWYCAYGKQTAENFFRDAKPVIELCKGLENRPYVVVDDGWQHNDEPRQTASYWGDWAWTRSSKRFGMEMDEFARRVTALGGKPGLWYRPLDFWAGANENERQLDCETAFDPTVPSVMKRIREDMERFRKWGMKLVKIDFLTHDVTGTWPCDCGEDLERALDSGRRWRDDSRTTVEVMKELYETLRAGAGDDVVIIGCNALNHLGAGLFEVQRTGDDTSGKTWEQTRADGVSVLGMRAIQNGTFFQADPDCVGLAEKGAVPWSRNAQFLEAVARSGQALFVSWRDALMDDDVRAALKRAFAIASAPRENGEPLDWESSRLPRNWRFADGERTFDWSDEEPSEDSELQRLCQRLCDEAVASGEQGGVQFCAYRDGTCIVDVCAGSLSTNAGSAKVTRDSLFPVFSTEKPLLATAVHRAVELGQMAYDRPLCTWWPELKGDGKERLTLRETLAYRSGMPGGTPGKLRSSDLTDWARVLKAAAADKPELEPGTKQRYMPLAYAWFLGHPLEVATGMALNDALREYVLIPAGIDREFYFAAPGEAFPRIAEFSHCGDFVGEMNRAYARRTCLPSAWAVASARSLARFYDRLCGYHGWKPLVRKETFAEAIRPCRHADDPLPADMNTKWYMLFGMGYGLWGEDTNINRIVGHGGAGGSEGLVDLEHRLTVGFTCNYDNHQGGLRARLYKAVGMKWRYWKDSDADIQTIQMKATKR